MNRKKSQSYFLAGLMSLGLFAGCRRSGSEALELSGTLEMTEHNLGARTAGRVTKLTVQEGDEVKKGQLIALLDRYDQTERDYRRADELFHQGGATKQTLENAELALIDQQIVSPLDGVVLTDVREEGEIVPSGGTVVVIGDRSDLWVRVYVREGDINRVQIGQPAAVHLDGVKKPLDGHVSFVAPQAEFTPRNVQTPEERVLQMFAVKVKLGGTQAGVRPGVSADVDLSLPVR